MTTRSPSSRTRPTALTPSRRKPPLNHGNPRAKVGFAFDRTVGEETWLTPRWLVDALDLPNAADVDPCSPMHRFWKTARRHYNVLQDGFNRAWDPAEFFWVNPPYGKVCGEWVGKAAEHGNGLLLIFARTDTAMFHRSVFGHPNTRAILFMEGRLKFANKDGDAVGTAGAPSVLVAYGRKAERHLRRVVRAGSVQGHLVVFPGGAAAS
jgi:hypothetical protein